MVGPGSGRVAGWAARGGEGGEGDFKAEGGELAGVVGDLAASGGLAFVVVRAEVVVAHAGAGQQLVVDPQLGVAESDLGLGLAASPGDPPVTGAFAGLGCGQPPRRSRRRRRPGTGCPSWIGLSPG